MTNSANVLALLNAVDEANNAFLPTGGVSSNLPLEVGKVTEFRASMPVWAQGTALDDEPTDVLEFTGGIDCTKASFVLTQANAYRQPQGGRDGMEKAQAAGAEPDWMTQMSMSISLVGAKLAIKDTDEDEWVYHTLHTRPEYRALATRALELYLTSPFRVSENVIDVVRDTLIEARFESDPYERTPDSVRQEIFNLVAPYPTSGNAAARIRRQQATGLHLAAVSVQGPRNTDEHDPFYYVTEQIRYGVMSIAALVKAGQEPTRAEVSSAYSLVTSLTGVNRTQERPAANRATVQSLRMLGEPIRNRKGNIIAYEEVQEVNFYEGLENDTPQS